MQSIGFKSFAKTPCTQNIMCTIVFTEINFWRVKIEAVACSRTLVDRTLGIFNPIQFNPIPETHTVHV